MDNNSQAPVKRKFFKKLVISSAVIAALITVLLVGSLLLLPKIVSTGTFKSYVEDMTGKAFTRKVRIDTLEWSWSEGIVIKNIFVADVLSFSGKPIFLI